MLFEARRKAFFVIWLCSAVIRAEFEISEPKVVDCAAVDESWSNNVGYLLKGYNIYYGE